MISFERRTVNYNMVDDSIILRRTTRWRRAACSPLNVNAAGEHPPASSSSTPRRAAARVPPRIGTHRRVPRRTRVCNIRSAAVSHDSLNDSSPSRFQLSFMIMYTVTQRIRKRSPSSRPGGCSAQAAARGGRAHSHQLARWHPRAHAQDTTLSQGRAVQKIRGRPLWGGKCPARDD